MEILLQSKKSTIFGIKKLNFRDDQKTKIVANMIRWNLKWIDEKTPRRIEFLWVQVETQIQKNWVATHCWKKGDKVQSLERKIAATPAWSSWKAFHRPKQPVLNQRNIKHFRELVAFIAELSRSLARW
jgi:hypothetical protein